MFAIALTIASLAFYGVSSHQTAMQQCDDGSSIIHNMEMDGCGDTYCTILAGQNKAIRGTVLIETNEVQELKLQVKTIVFGIPITYTLMNLPCKYKNTFGGNDNSIESYPETQCTYRQNQEVNFELIFPVPRGADAAKKILVEIQAVGSDGHKHGCLKITLRINKK